MKRLPYGNSNFASVITDGYCYVDKTRFVELLENENNKYQLFIRPRKFGKSLFFSTLYHYYDLNRADEFERLFGGLYIGQNPTPRRSSYMVMQFDFSGLNTSTAEEFKISFSRSIQATVRRFVSCYGDFFSGYEALIRKMDTENFGVQALHIAYGGAEMARKKIFVIIDEYDHFANDLIAMGNLMGDKTYRSMVEANGLVRNFYETLKIGTKSVVDRIFITGISPVMLNDLTSGFNIADNLSLKRKYNEMMGFTQEEVLALMAETGVNPDRIGIDMEHYYNGYLFNESGENRVYNPSMVLYFFNRIADEQKMPPKIIDDNLRTDYGRLQRLAQSDQNCEKLLEIAKEGGATSEIIAQFSIDSMYDDKYFVSLLFYMGLLTIDKVYQGRTRLKIPNYSIQTLYWEYISQLTANLNSKVTVDLTDQNAAIEELAYGGNPNPYVEYVSANIFGRLSNRDLIRFDEKYIKIMLLNGLFQSNLYVPVSEMEVKEGYVDVYLQRHPRLPDVKYEWLLEIKYLKSEEEGELPGKRREALAQLERYRQAAPFASRADVKCAALLFVGKKKYEVAELQG
jgi:hypothetical protein